MAPIALYDDARDFIHDTCLDPLESLAYRENQLEKGKHEPIAVVGFSFKFPREATTPEAFWQMLCDRKCSMTDWPKDRVNVDSFYHPDSKRHDTVRGIPLLLGEQQLTVVL